MGAAAMRRLAWSQLRFGTPRLAALLAGLLLATTAFTVLTAASRTAQLRTVGTVSSHFVPAYEILVRPRGARTRLEVQTATVQPNFLAGIYGGITMAQYHEIAGLPGVSVAAPIAMVGYALIPSGISFYVPAADYRGPGRQLYRFQTTWVSDGGTSRVTQPAGYTYVTPDQLQFNSSSGAEDELVPGHGTETACPNSFGSLTASPFGIANQQSVNCWSRVDGLPGFHLPAPPYLVAWTVPVLIAAIDPAAVDENSLVLFVLILAVCVLFVANSATAAIRGRRRELGVLACLGWTRPRLFTAVLGELAAIGLAAGVLGAVAALPLSAALGLRASPERAVLAVPVAIAVAVIAGLIPAWLAARADPVASIRPAVLATARGRLPGGVTGLAATNVLRTPSRALVGAVSLAVGISTLTMVTALSLAFRGVVVGSLLGDAVAVQVRGVDYIAVAATVLLGVLAVADVMFLNITERATELAAIRAFDWPEATLVRLVVTEGVIIGLAGSLAGAALGLGAAAAFAGQAPGFLYLVAAAAVVAGVLVTAAAAVVPTRALRRLPATHLLAAD